MAVPRRRKEETVEKERSESGRRGGREREGKLRKEWETRDGERALSAVEEMWRRWRDPRKIL